MRNARTVTVRKRKNSRTEHSMHDMAGRVARVATVNNTTMKVMTP